ncbi:hypothetical protein BP5796_10891 [Coleophoma crateriformis]|uniref:Uncharacterized protein n=1 Tax=Coleophoma crateriformis TaxID=565419 RepID=A0A3D8QLB7_9HELO|nr:hypothetical protein BP5796_10891 [Coleophoma crateriformis]
MTCLLISALGAVIQIAWSILRFLVCVFILTLLLNVLLTSLLNVLLSFLESLLPPPPGTPTLEQQQTRQPNPSQDIDAVGYYADNQSDEIRAWLGTVMDSAQEGRNRANSAGHPQDLGQLRKRVLEKQLRERGGTVDLGQGCMDRCPRDC